MSPLNLKIAAITAVLTILGIILTRISGLTDAASTGLEWLQTIFSKATIVCDAFAQSVIGAGSSLFTFFETAGKSEGFQNFIKQMESLATSLKEQWISGELFKIPIPKFAPVEFQVGQRAGSPLDYLFKGEIRFPTGEFEEVNLAALSFGDSLEEVAKKNKQLATETSIAGSMVSQLSDLLAEGERIVKDWGIAVKHALINLIPGFGQIVSGIMWVYDTLKAGPEGVGAPKDLTGPLTKMNEATMKQRKLMEDYYAYQAKARLYMIKETYKGGGTGPPIKPPLGEEETKGSESALNRLKSFIAKLEQEWARATGNMISEVDAWRDKQLETIQQIEDKLGYSLNAREVLEKVYNTKVTKLYEDFLETYASNIGDVEEATRVKVKHMEEKWTGLSEAMGQISEKLLAESQIKLAAGETEKAAKLNEEAKKFQEMMKWIKDALPDLEKRMTMRGAIEAREKLASAFQTQLSTLQGLIPFEDRRVEIGLELVEYENKLADAKLEQTFLDVKLNDAQKARLTQINEESKKWREIQAIVEKLKTGGGPGPLGSIATRIRSLVVCGLIHEFSSSCIAPTVCLAFSSQ